MTATLFAAIGLGELAVAGLALAAVQAWRRFGPRSVMSFVALLAILGEGVALVLDPKAGLAQGLAVCALLSYGAVLCTDEKARAAILRRR